MNFRINSRVAAAIVATATTLLAGAGTTSAGTIGVAVSSTSTSADIGLHSPSPLGAGAIGYYITLGDSNGTYGVSDSSCGGVGSFGKCSDFGNGGGVLTMILRFDPVAAAKSLLTITFQDLDLHGRNDPEDFYEHFRLLTGSGSPLTNWITDTGGVISDFGGPVGDPYQRLSLLIDTVPGVPTYLKLKFESHFDDGNGTNTIEYLRAEISPVPLGPAPLPMTLAMMLGGWFLWRKRQRAATPGTCFTRSRT